VTDDRAASPDEGTATSTDEALVGLAAQVQALFLERGLTVATAESCTGGLVAHLITEVAGSSGYLRGGIVAYADEAKEQLLDVPRDVLAAHGAVSAQVARAMAEGASTRFGTDMAVAVTGVAGPGGGSAAKPVGLAYIAVAAGSAIEVRRFQWTGNRAENKRASAEAALRLLLEVVADRPARERLGSTQGRE
jgi:nicotinamide-nucleotide amidase